MGIDRLRHAGLLETIAPDRDGALVILDACERHIASAASIAATDPSGAFQLTYDATRKAVNALMLANGVRARGNDRVGGHVVVGRYAQATFGAIAGEAVGEFDRMRRRRNR